MRGGGAWCDDRPIRASATTDIRHALVATGFSYLPERRVAQGARVARIIDRVRDIRRSGAAAYDLCCVAAGRVDVYFEEWLGAWDIAAGELIAAEAGCRTGSFDGGPVDPSNVLVATPALFDADDRAAPRARLSADRRTMCPSEPAIAAARLSRWEPAS